MAPCLIRPCHTCYTHTLSLTHTCSHTRSLAPTRTHTGDKRLFIRYDELEAAWELFTPLLHEIESRKVGAAARGTKGS